jgi:hypothetical protein
VFNHNLLSYKGNGERYDSMLIPILLLNIMELLYGVIPMALIIFYIINLENINYLTFTRKISLSEVHIHDKR